MNAPTFAVKHKTTGLLLAGFAADNSPVWTDDEAKARHHPNLQAAESQAILLIRFGVNVQRKPIAL